MLYAQLSDFSQTNMDVNKATEYKAKAKAKANVLLLLLHSAY